MFERNLQAICREAVREKTLCLKKAFLPETKAGAMHSRRRVVHARRKEKDNEVKVGKQLLFLLKSVFSLSHLRCPGLFGGTCISRLGENYIRLPNHLTFEISLTKICEKVKIRILFLSLKE